MKITHYLHHLQLIYTLIWLGFILDEDILLRFSKHGDGYTRAVLLEMNTVENKLIIEISNFNTPKWEASYHGALSSPSRFYFSLKQPQP